MMRSSPWRASLLPFAWGFGAVTGLRNRCFDWGLMRERGAGVPVISVGNIVAGGTGKTPFVEYLAKILIEKGLKLAMVSRGYGRRSRGVAIVSDGAGAIVSAHHGGDEPVQVARRFPRLAVVVGEDRVAAARCAVEELRAEVILLDDGYQHRALRRECDILLLDARTNIAREPMLPAGYRREPLGGMRRADLIVFTRVDPAAEGVPWEPVLRRWYGGPLAVSRIATEGFYRASDGQRASLQGTSCFAFSGIADHAGFVAGLGALGIRIAGEHGYADHHRYSQADLDHLARAFERSGAEMLLTTEKDLMRLTADEELRHRACEVLPLVYSRIELQLIRGEEELLGMIDRTVSRSAA